jgi:hypothetical protein
VSIRPRRAALLALVVALAVPALAQAHGGNPNFRSVFRTITPAMPGVTAEVLGYDEYYQLTSHSPNVVTVYGYDGEPYLRILPNGTTQQNVNSPAVYLNVDRLGTAPVPAHASSHAPVVWRTMDRTGRLTWHDHRIHYAGSGTPPQVKHSGRRTKIFDYRIPIADGATKGDIEGTLYWVGPSGGGLPIGAIVAFAVLLLGGVALVVVVRRRRGASDGGADDDAGTPDGPEPAPASAREAW